MSDIEDVTADATAPADVEAPAVEETKEAPETPENPEAPETAEEPESPEGEEGQEKPKKRSSTERYRRKISYLVGSNESLANKVAELERELSSARETKPERPDPAKYQSGEFDPKFIEDLSEWKYRSLRAEEKAAEPKAVNVDPRIREFEQKAKAFPDLDAKAKEFMEEGGSLPPHVIAGLSRAQHGTAVLNHLLSNPETAFELAEMTAEEALLKIGELNAAFKSAPKKAVTKAPAPPTPVRGGASSGFDPETASMDEYVAKRNAGWGN